MRQFDRRAEQFTVFGHRLTRVEPDTDAEGRFRIREVVTRHFGLDGDCAFDRHRGRGEACHHAMVGPPHFFATLGGQRQPDDAFMFLECLYGTLIIHRLS
jgi:hypothetical protein